MWWWLVGCVVTGSKDPVDSDVVDSDVVDTDAADTDVVDTDAVDTDPSDTDPADTDDSDLPVDTGPQPFVPDPTCAYLDLDVYMVTCGGVRTSMRRWVPEDGDPACPPYFTVDGDPWLRPEDALAASGCDDDCVYQAFQSVMLLYCDVRGEYIVWVSGGPGTDPTAGQCQDLYEVHTVAGDAWVYDLAVYEANFPCP